MITRINLTPFSKNIPGANDPNQSLFGQSNIPLVTPLGWEDETSWKHEGGRRTTYIYIWNTKENGRCKTNNITFHK